MFGAISAGIANEIGTIFRGNPLAKALAHGVSRSVLAKAQGGRWSSGFWSGFASSLFGGWTSSIQNTNLRFVMNVIAGGTVSQLSGGKFANGAVSSAFVWMYNKHSHNTLNPYAKKLIIVKEIDVVKERAIRIMLRSRKIRGLKPLTYEQAYARSLAIENRSSKIADVAGLALSVGAAALEGPVAVGMGLGAIALDVYQGDKAGQYIGGTAFAVDMFVKNIYIQIVALGADIIYGVSQVFK